MKEELKLKREEERLKKRLREVRRQLAELKKDRKRDVMDERIAEAVAIYESYLNEGHNEKKARLKAAAELEVCEFTMKRYIMLHEASMDQ